VPKILKLPTVAYARLRQRCTCRLVLGLLQLFALLEAAEKMKGYMKIGIGGLVLIVFGAMFGWVIFPKVLYSKMHSVRAFIRVHWFLVVTGSGN
jgi:hypothetical protein